MTRRKRPENVTLEKFYGNAPEDIRSYVSEYESMRYRGQVPQEDAVRSFTLRGRLLLKNLSRR